ncbi:MAG: response regulator transcription factor [Saprospiraceae bacterium]|nr:response regulator transcription factor [Saprospiraceae bacterium]
MKSVIVEDEEMIANQLVGKIKKVAPDIEIVTILSSLKKARKWFSENSEPDLLFMDIQLSDGVSLDIFNDFPLKCPVVFTTAYDEYALRAFKANGIDYILKPVKDEELKAAINKCRQYNHKTKAPDLDIQKLIDSLSINEKSEKYKEKWVANFRNQWIPVNTREIACFAKEAMIHIYMMNGDKFTMDITSLDELEDQLDPQLFFRANRQYIINIDAIASVKPIENSKLIIHLKEPNHKLDVDTSRQKSPEFKKWLEQ